jgi:hypothetical protein
MKKHNTKNFIEKAVRIHGTKFKYDLVEYKGVKEKIKIICNHDHIFEQTPNDHLNGHGCKKCSGWGAMKFNNNEFLDRLNKVYGNSLIYNDVIYKGHDEPVTLICPLHGDFIKKPKDLIIKKSGCPKCGYIKSTNKRKKTNDEFIEISNKIHNNIYDYSLVDYKRANTKVKIVCKQHGVFEQSPKDHIHQNQGCSLCSSSKGEKLIRLYLTNNNIYFEEQKRFEDCINPSSQRVLPFDFYIPKFKTCIEFDGEQHFSPVEWFGGVEKFNYIVIRDNVKNEYCKNNNIKLIRIKFNQITQINKILKKSCQTL